MIDFSIKPNNVVLTNDIDILLQEIDTLFDTSKGELFTNPAHSTDFERFLWNTNISTDSISDYIKYNIQTKCDTFDYVIKVSTTAHLGTENDIILVRIDIENDRYVAKRTYKIG